MVSAGIRITNQKKRERNVSQHVTEPIYYLRLPRNRTPNTTAVITDNVTTINTTVNLAAGNTPLVNAVCIAKYLKHPIKHQPAKHKKCGLLTEKK
jgi:hypothetical protein